jgi:diguanylate cyclase (GGDEF)-like protein
MQLYGEFVPDLVITDWMLPDGTGLEICRAIRSDARTSYCYIVLLTAQTEKEQIVCGLSAGADDYLTKPFHEGELLARLSTGRRLVELQRELQSKNQLLEELALTDPLTQLPNRRAIEQIAVREMSAGARHNFPVWIAIADLDHFKKINDSYGHDVGDQVICGFAHVLRSHGRQSNSCGRFGGEEFLIVLSHADVGGVEIALQRFLRRFAAQEFVAESEVCRCTASFGFTCTSAGEDFRSAVARADRALYRAKTSGRNRIEFAPSRGPEASCETE